MTISPSQSEFVELTGRWWESIVGGRAAGRILGWLLICEPAHQSAAQLAETLQMSSGSVSTQVRLLESLGLVGRVTFPGDRSTYYEIGRDAWPGLLEQEGERIRAMVDLATAATRVMPEERPDRVEGMKRVGDFFMAEWPELMERMRAFLSKERQETE